MFLSRRNGIYYLWYSDKSGKRRKVSTRSKSKSDALIFIKKYQPKNIDLHSNMMFSAFVLKFQVYAQSTFRPGTWDLYELSFNSFIEIVGDHLMKEITSYEIDKYKSKLCENICLVTVNMRLAKLKAAFNTAKRWGWIDKNPFEGIKMMSVPETIPVYLSKQDFKTFYQGIKEEWLKHIVLWALLTGMRRGEILNLKYNQIDLEKRIVVVQSSPTFYTKAGRIRKIPLNEDAIRLLDKINNGSSEKDELVFTLNNKAIFEDWVTHKFKKYVTLLLPNNPDVHFHSLRHTFASWLVQDGASLYEVQKLLGHSSPVVSQIYSHLAPEKMHSTVNRISVGDIL
jgi:integrase